MTLEKRVETCRQKIIGAINEAEIPYTVSRLILESVLFVVKQNIADEEKAMEAKEAEKNA